MPTFSLSADFAIMLCILAESMRLDYLYHLLWFHWREVGLMDKGKITFIKPQKRKKNVFIEVSVLSLINSPSWEHAYYIMKTARIIGLPVLHRPYSINILSCAAKMKVDITKLEINGCDIKWTHSCQSFQKWDNLQSVVKRTQRPQAFNKNLPMTCCPCWSTFGKSVMNDNWSERLMQWRLNVFVIYDEIFIIIITT